MEVDKRVGGEIARNLAGEPPQSAYPSIGIGINTHHTQVVGWIDK